MLNLFSELLDVPLSVVELVGKAVETVGELTEIEAVKDVGKMISDNADTIAK